MPRKGLIPGLILLFLGVLLFVFFLRRHFDPELLRQLSAADAAVVAALYLSALAFNAFNVQVLFKGLGRTVPWWKIQAVMLAGGSVTILAPFKLGVPVRVFLYRRFLDIPYGLGAMEIAVEAVLLLSSMFAFLFLPSRIFVDKRLYLLLICFFVAAALAGWLALRFFKARLSNLTFARRFLEKIESGLAGLSRIHPIYKLYLVIAFPAYLMLGLIVKWFLINRMWNGPVSLMDVTVADVLSYVSATLSMVPLEGLGVKEAAFSPLLAQAGVPASVSVSALVVYRIFYTFCTVCLGATVWLFLITHRIIRPSEMRNLKNTSAQEQEEHS